MYWPSKIKRLIGLERAPKLPAEFSSDGAKARVERTLLANPAIRGDAAIASRLIESGELIFFRRGDQIIKQGGQDNDVYFLLAGEVDIVFRSQLGSKREAPNQIGEMAAIELGRKRSASVYALTDEVAAIKVPGSEFHKIWTDNPTFQQFLQVEMSSRHRECIAAGEVARRNNSTSWFFISAGVGVVSAIIAWLFLFPADWTQDARIASSGAAGLGLFIVALVHNPAFFSRRCCGIILLAMVGTFALDQFISVEAEQGLASLQISIGSGDEVTDWKATLVNQSAFILALMICALMDYRTNPD